MRQEGRHLMRNISISDVTMKQSAQEGGFSLSFREKIELAKLLDRLNVSVIETAAIENARTDSLLIKSLASAVKNSALAVSVKIGGDIEQTWEALKDAKHPRLQIEAPVSAVQMEYVSRRKPDAVLSDVCDMIRKAKTLCSEVEFVAEDAGRSEGEFLGRIVAGAVEAGADIITVCDSAGTMLPEESGRSVAAVREKTPSSVRIGVRVSNALCLADSCSLYAAFAGADEIKVSSSGNFTASLENITKIIRTKGSDFGIVCSVRDTEIRRVSERIHDICETKKSKSSPFENGVMDDGGALLTINDDISEVQKLCAKLGYELSDEDAINVYEEFRRIASKKESVGEKELDAIIASAAMQVPPTYVVERYVVNSGNLITPTCHIRLKKGDRSLDGLSAGDGPVDASFLAIEQVIGHHYELDDFQIQAVTEGREAMGETVVRLRSSIGKLYSGRGISTDVIGSAIRAYINAVNKIVYEEGGNV